MYKHEAESRKIPKPIWMVRQREYFLDSATLVIFCKLCTCIYKIGWAFKFKLSKTSVGDPNTTFIRLNLDSGTTFIENLWTDCRKESSSHMWCVCPPKIMQHHSTWHGKQNWNMLKYEQIFSCGEPMKIHLKYDVPLCCIFYSHAIQV